MRHSQAADLTDLAALARVEGAELRGVLVRAQAELFAAASALDHAAIRAFESVMTGLIAKAHPDDAAAAASLLAHHPLTPPRVLEALVEASVEAARIVLAKAPKLPAGAAAAAVWRDPKLAAAYAARADLPAEAPELLSMIGDPQIDAALAGNPAVMPGGRFLAGLLERCDHTPDLARALLHRGDLSPDHRAALYVHADEAGRREIRESLAEENMPQARGEGIGLSASVERLVALAAAGDVARFERALASALGCPAVLPWTYGSPAGRELTMLALLGLGAAPSDTITVALTLEASVARSTGDIFHLADLARTTPRDVAARITEAVIGRTPRETRRTTHVPVTSDGSPIRRSVFGLLRQATGQDGAERAARRTAMP